MSALVIDIITSAVPGHSSTEQSSVVETELDSAPKITASTPTDGKSDQRGVTDLRRKLNCTFNSSL